MQTAKEIPLTDFSPGDKIKITKLMSSQGIGKRMSQLGLFRGSLIRVIQNQKWVPMILEIFNSRIAVGRKEAEKIYGISPCS